MGGGLDAPEYVAAADDQTDLDPDIVDRLHFLRDAFQRVRVQAENPLAHQGFAGQLQKDAPVFRFVLHGPVSSCGDRVSEGVPSAGKLGDFGSEIVFLALNAFA